MILETIEKENDIKNVKPEDWNQLAEEIREFLINKIIMICLFVISHQFHIFFRHL